MTAPAPTPPAEPSRRVLVAKPRGYCAGVDRAVLTVEKALEAYGAPVYVRKQIVHNAHVVRTLEAQGAVFVEEADEVLRRAVERQLQADVEVGVFLSGGVDSALVLDYAVELGARPRAFTIGFAGTGDYDESEAAAAVTRRLGGISCMAGIACATCPGSRARTAR